MNGQSPTTVSSDHKRLDLQPLNSSRSQGSQEANTDGRNAHQISLDAAGAILLGIPCKYFRSHRPLSWHVGRRRGGYNGLCLTTIPFPLPLSSTFPQSYYALEEFAGLSLGCSQFWGGGVGASRDGGVFGWVGMGTPLFPHTFEYLAQGRTRDIFFNCGCQG